MSKAHRWIIVSSLDLSVQDGQRSHIHEFVRAISKQAQTTLINLGVPSEDISEDIDFIPVFGAAIHIPILSNALNLLRELRKVEKHAIPEVIYVRASGHYPDAITLSYARLMGIRSVLEVNGAFREEHAAALCELHGWRRWRGQLSFWSGLFFQKLSFRLANRVIVVTNNLKSYVNSSYGTPLQNIGVFSNGVNIDKFIPLSRDICRLNLELDPNKRYIGFVGNLAPWQGLDHLIRAIHLLDDKLLDVCLLIVGDGVEKDRLKNLVNELDLSEQVKFIGKIPHEKVVTFINACDVCVGSFNARRRNQLTGLSPLKIYEYLACGRPVVVSNIPDLEFIKLEQVGNTFHVEEPSDMARVLTELLLLTPTQWQIMSEKARQLAVERYSWDIIVRNIAHFVTTS